MSIEGVLVFYRTTEYANSWEGGGGLTARRKRKSSLLRPPPLFPESRSQKGGRNSGAVRYYASATGTDCSASADYVVYIP